MKRNDIIVVSGLPRSGTSLMMQILQALGVNLFTDNERPSDVSNPKGYYENQKVKSLENDTSWIKDVQGKAIKVISPLIIYLPEDFCYKIIFMQRNYDEIIASQEKMLNSTNKKETNLNSETLKTILKKDTNQAFQWIHKNKNAEMLEINFNELIENPKTGITKISHFLDIKASLIKAIKVVDKKLYRTRIH